MARSRQIAGYSGSKKLEKLRAQKKSKDRKNETLSSSQSEEVVKKRRVKRLTNRRFERQVRLAQENIRSLVGPTGAKRCINAILDDIDLSYNCRFGPKYRALALESAFHTLRSILASARDIVLVNKSKKRVTIRSILLAVRTFSRATGSEVFWNNFMRVVTFMASADAKKQMNNAWNNFVNLTPTEEQEAKLVEEVYEARREKNREKAKAKKLEEQKQKQIARELRKKEREARKREEEKEAKKKRKEEKKKKKSKEVEEKEEDVETEASAGESEPEAEAE